MFELTAFCVIVLLYIIPLNLFFYYLSKQTVISILEFQSTASQGSINVGAAFFYVLYVFLFFIFIYLLLRFIVIKSIYVYFGHDINANNFLLKYKRGQNSINAVSSIIIALVLLLHVFFRVFDIKIFMFGFLCLVFIFRSIKVK